MRITTEDELRAIYGAPHGRAAAKELDHLDKHCRRIIELSPMLLLGTSDGVKQDVSPKGDAPGFVKVEDDRSLLIPDWPGNNRIDGLRNILERPEVGMIFLIPNVRETLRVAGTATIHDDEDLRGLCAQRGKLPITVTRVAVRNVFLHCGKAMIRSNLWKPETWPERSELPTMGEMIMDHAKLDKTPVSDEAFEEIYQSTLY
jgi:hypothetical protein